MSVTLSSLLTRAVALLDAATYFSDIAVVELTDGTIESRVQQVLFARGLQTSDGSKTVKLGMACIVSITSADITGDRRVRLTPVLRVAVIENPTFNHGDGGTQKSVLDVCTEVFKAICAKSAAAGIAADDSISTINGTSLEIISADVKRSLYGIEGGNAYHCNFTVGGIPL